MIESPAKWGFINVLFLFMFLFGGSLPYIFQARKIINLGKPGIFSVRTNLILITKDLTSLILYLLKNHNKTDIFISITYLIVRIILLLIKLIYQAIYSNFSNNELLTLWYFFVFFQILIFTFLIILVCRVPNQKNYYCLIIEKLKLISSFIYPIPQLFSCVYQRSTKGLSIIMIMSWIVSGIFISYYYLVHFEIKYFFFQFFIQVLVSFSIMLCFFIYS